MAEGVHGLAADVTIRIGEETLGERTDLLAVLAEDPEGLDAAGSGSRRIAGNRGQRGGRGFFKGTVSERLPGEMGVTGDLGAEAGDQVGRRELGVIGHGLRHEALRFDAPDTARLLVAIGVVTGDFVVTDDLIIPVDDVKAAIRTHRHGNRTEERVFTGDEVIELFEAIARALAMLADRVDLRGDRVGDIHHAIVTLRPDADVGKRETAQAAAAHLEIRRLHRERRLIGLREAIGAAGIERVFMERHHGIAVVIGLLDEALPFTGQREAPDVAGTDARRLEEATIRTEAGHTRAREIDLLAFGGDDRTSVEGSLRQPEPTPRRAGELVREKVRVLHAEARQQDLTLVGFTIGVGVTEKDDVVAVLDDGAVLVRQDAFGDRQTIGESARLADARLERLVKDDDLIAGLGLIKRLGGGGVLVSVDRVFQRGAGPRPALLVEDQHDELAEIGGLLGEELDLETFGQLEELLLFLGRATHALDVVIAPVILSGSRLGRSDLLRLGLHLVPGQRARRGGQLFDRDVLGLDDRHAAGVDLDADLAVGRDVRGGLDVIERRHAVDPAADAVALGEDAILVPLALLHGGEDGGRVLRFGDDLVAAALVVDLAIPALAVIYLVATHLSAVRDAHAADLHAAVDEARAGQAQLEAKVEVLIGLLGREEEVLRDLRRKRTAADLAVLDAPPGGVALPAGEGLAIEDRDRGGLDGQGEEQGQKTTHGKMGLRII